MISILLWLIRCSMRLANQLSSLPHFSSRMENNEKFFIHFSRVPEQSRQCRGDFSLFFFFYIITPPSVVNTQNILSAVAPGPTWPSFTTLSTDQRKGSGMETFFFCPFFSTTTLTSLLCAPIVSIMPLLEGSKRRQFFCCHLVFTSSLSFSYFLPPPKFIVYVSSLDLKQESAWEGLRRSRHTHMKMKNDIWNLIFILTLSQNFPV